MPCSPRAECRFELEEREYLWPRPAISYSNAAFGNSAARASFAFRLATTIAADAAGGLGATTASSTCVVSAFDSSR